MLFQKKRTFSILAVSEESGFLEEEKSRELVQATKQKLHEHIARNKKSKKAFEERLEKTTVIYPWQWDSPKNFSAPLEVLGGESWSRICMHICEQYGDFGYHSRKNKAVHMLFEDCGIALFQFTTWMK